jgi:hypothetical protein
VVLVNYGNATGQEILNVSEIFKTIYKIFGIHIEASKCNWQLLFGNDFNFRSTQNYFTTINQSIL